MTSPIDKKKKKRKPVIRYCANKDCKKALVGVFLRYNKKYCSRECTVKVKTELKEYTGGFKPTLYDPKYAVGGEVFLKYVEHIHEANKDFKVTRVEIAKGKYITANTTGIEIPSIEGYAIFMGNFVLAITVSRWGKEYPLMQEAIDFILQLREYYTMNKASKGHIKSESIIKALLRKHGYLEEEEKPFSLHLHEHFGPIEKIYREAEIVDKSADKPDRLSIIKSAGLYE